MVCKPVLHRHEVGGGLSRVTRQVVQKPFPTGARPVGVLDHPPVNRNQQIRSDDTRGREAVRALARQIAKLAQTDENRRRQQLWCDANSLRKPERPPVRCEAPIGELMPRASLVSEDRYLVGVEARLRGLLTQWELGDDTPIEPFLTVPYVMRLEGEHVWGLPVRHIQPTVEGNGTSAGAAWQYEPPIKEEADLDRLTPPRYHYDREATERNVDRLHDLLGDILPVQLTSGDGYQLHGLFGAWLHGWATGLRGVTQLLMDLMERPEWVHRLMQFLRDGYLSALDQFEEQGVLALNNVGWLACDDLPQPDFDPERVRLKDLWGRSESQEFHGVSPAQYEEFLLQYQKPILERFGIVFYGCCEDLTPKIDRVLSIPNLRRFVCSAWTDLESVVDAVGDRYAIEWRQKASDVVYAGDLSQVRTHLDNGLRCARGSRIMVVLREVQTLAGRPDRAAEWVRLAKDLAAKHA